MDNFQKDIDDRANLTLSNRFELLLFRLGTSLHEQKSELFGINVFKLREIVPMPAFTRPAGMKAPLLGMVNIRDQVIPVIDLPAVAGCKPETGLNILLITEYARSVQAFAVESVENIMRLDWKQVHTAEKAVNGRYITSIACLDEDKETNNLALVLDVEQILYDIVPSSHDLRATNLKTNKFLYYPRRGSHCGGRLQSRPRDAGKRAERDGNSASDARDRQGCMGENPATGAGSGGRR